MKKYEVFKDGIGYQDGKARVIVGGKFFNGVFVLRGDEKIPYAEVADDGTD
jgi:hypothetical protein